MIMRKWLLSAVTLTLALSTAGAVTAFALTGDGRNDTADGQNTAGEVTHGDPTYEVWLSNYKPTKVPVTSIDDIDPSVCNLVHNIKACSPEELEEAFGALTDIASEETHGKTEPVVGLAMCSLEVPDCNDTLVITQDEGGEIEPGFEVGGNPEPLVVDGEPGYRVQSPRVAIEQDCGLAGGDVSITSDGEIECVVAQDLEDGSQGLVSSAQPPVIEPMPAPATP